MMCKTYFHFSRNQDVITGILNFTLRRVSWENDLIKNEITGLVVIFADKAEGFTQAAL